MNKTIIKATTEQFDAQIIKNSQPVLVDFWAEWCGPCRAQGPILEELSNELQGKVTIAKVNVDDNPQLAEQFDVMSIPALLIFNQGKVVHQIVGLRSKEQLLSTFKDLELI